MKSIKPPTPPPRARLPTSAAPPRRPLTWWSWSIKSENRLVQLKRERNRRPPAEMDEIVARALEEAMQETIAEEQDEERADELRRRAAARALARMFRKGPRLVYSRPLPIQRSKNVIARPDNNRHKREVESFQAMLDERRRRRPHLVVDNARQPDEHAA